MHSLAPLLLLAAAACARPAGQTPAPLMALEETQSLRKLSEERLGDYYLPRILIPKSFNYDGRVPPPPTDKGWISMEIDRINRMNEASDNIGPYAKSLPRMVKDPYIMKKFQSPTIRNEESSTQGLHYSDRLPSASALIAPDLQDPCVTPHYNKDDNRKHVEDIQRSNFALTPMDKGYFDTYTQSNDNLAPETLIGHHEGGDMSSSQMEQPRQIRQNPNLSKTKNLVAGQLDILRKGLSGDDSGTTEKPRSIRVLETATPEAADSIFSLAVVAALGTALTLAIIAFAFGWYTISKRAKAAADVDYPAYGVTGPTVDVSGDRKLAHSAHMYHYQHQKQQIIAMERSGMEQRNGSVSDPESEEENEEGDYTVYECPGFATTGDMEVKNPLFTEDPTPATPGKCELVKPQPED